MDSFYLIQTVASKQLASSFSHSFSKAQKLGPSPGPLNVCVRSLEETYFFIMCSKWNLLSSRSQPKTTQQQIQQLKACFQLLHQTKNRIHVPKQFRLGLNRTKESLRSDWSQPTNFLLWFAAVWAIVSCVWVILGPWPWSPPQREVCLLWSLLQQVLPVIHLFKCHCSLESFK